MIIANIWKNKKYSKPPIRYCGSCIIPPIFVKLEQYPIVSTKPPLYHVVPWNSHWLQFYIPYHIPFYPHIIVLCFKPLYNISNHIPYPLNPIAFTITSHVISQWSSIKVDKLSYFTHLHVSKYRVKVSSPIIQWSPHSQKQHMGKTLTSWWRMISPYQTPRFQRCFKTPIVQRCCPLCHRCHRCHDPTRPGDRVNLDGSLAKSTSWSTVVLKNEFGGCSEGIRGKVGGILWDCSENWDIYL